MSYVERQIIITITLQARQGLPSRGVEANMNPTFQGTSSNTVRLTGGGPADKNGLRISAQITRPGAPGLGEANVQIYNLPLTLINQIGTLGVPYVYMVGANSITIEAGDANTQPTTLFKGTINSAYVDFAGSPESIFNISAQAISLFGAAPATAIGYNGAKSVSTLLQTLASQMGLTLINNFPEGNAPLLSCPYLHGSLRDQVRSIAQDAGLSWNIDDVKSTLTIWPKNGSSTLTDSIIPILAPPPKGNMVGYPSYTQQGIKVRAEFNTAFEYGATVEVKSSLTQASGNWVIYYLDYDLECQTPNGPWFVNLEMAAPGFPIFPQSSSP